MRAFPILFLALLPLFAQKHVPPKRSSQIQDGFGITIYTLARSHRRHLLRTYKTTQAHDKPSRPPGCRAPHPGTPTRCPRASSSSFDHGRPQNAIEMCGIFSPPVRYKVPTRLTSEPPSVGSWAFARRRSSQQMTKCFGGCSRSSRTHSLGYAIGGTQSPVGGD